MLEKKIKIAQSLQDTLAILNTNKELEEVMDYIVIQAKEILEADAAAIYAPYGKSGDLHIVASKGLSLDYVQKASIPKGIGATGLASISSKPVAIEEISKFLEYQNIKLDDERKILVDKLGLIFKSMLVIPLLFTNGKPYGTLDLYYGSSQKFTEDEIKLATAYANQTILAIENARLRASVTRSATIAERNRITRELHDTVSQTLFSISLIADVLPDLWNSNHRLGEKALEELSQLSKGALIEMRSVLIELKPITILNIELELLIQQLVDAFTSHNRIAVDYQYKPIQFSLPSEVKFAFYRIVQETLRNIEKHGHASKVNIYISPITDNDERVQAISTFNKPDKKLAVIIEDDGIGFYPATITGDHFGLRIMYDRAQEINAVINIESEPGNGTRIVVVW